MERFSAFEAPAPPEEVQPLSIGIAASVSGSPTGNYVIPIAIERECQIPVDAVGSRAECLFAPALDQEIAIEVDGTQIGTISFAESSLVGVWACTPLLMVPGQMLVYRFPASADADWRDIGITMMCNRGADPGTEVVVGVSSFNGRTGNVLPVEGDYTTDQITDSSGITGTTLTEALNVLQSASTVKELLCVCGTETETATVGEKFHFRLPRALTIVDLRANVNVAPTGHLLIDVLIAGVTIMSVTKLRIDATTQSSVDSAAPPEIDAPDGDDNAFCRVEVVSAGGTPGQGLKVWIYYVGA